MTYIFFPEIKIAPEKLCCGTGTVFEQKDKLTRNKNGLKFL